MENRKVLIKYGGNAMISDELKHSIAKRIKQLRDADIQVVLVHGGGPFINKALEGSGIVSEFFDGHRHTSLEALTCIERTLKGEVNSSLVNLFNKQGLKAVGLSGKDGKLVTAKKRWHTQKNEQGEPIKVDLGQVGDVEKVEVSLLNILLQGGFTPVITCIASDEEGNDYNINGDVFAGKIASSLGVDEYIVLTDVDGLFLDFPDPASIVKDLKLSSLKEYYGTVIQGGMIPKINSCEDALKEGVKKAIIMNGTKPNQITDYLLHNKKTGTTLSK
ncbi:acetylglutamate kinase [Pleomorphovibrio marinus]|uniref:acetylglutamate kinase n=1 Tax=Pleomorphovibrio marinus TaxID=2164132 RepID=UPI000E0BDACF|nr:acetylglutamate kinase [Pleomorphovibrio marinus]